MPVTVMLFADKANACSCMAAGPQCQSYFAVDAVFVGTVRTILPLERTRESGPPIVSRSVVFTVERAFRGVQGTMAEVGTRMGGGDCGFPFKAGGRYLVYAYRTTGRMLLTTGTCTRTRPIAEAADDLQFIEGLPPVGRGARVYGTITHKELDVVAGHSWDYGRVPFIHVLLRGPSTAFDVQTDEQGRYEISGVPPGSYELQVVPPPMFSARYHQSKIELRDSRSLSVADFFL